MALSAPTVIVFIISVVIAALAMLAATGVLVIIPIPSISLMGLAYVVLVIGCLFKGF